MQKQDGNEDFGLFATYTRVTKIVYGADSTMIVLPNGHAMRPNAVVQIQNNHFVSCTRRLLAGDASILS